MKHKKISRNGYFVELDTYSEVTLEALSHTTPSHDEHGSPELSQLGGVLLHSSFSDLSAAAACSIYFWIKKHTLHISHDPMFGHQN